MKRGVAIACGASAILHVSVLVALDGIDPERERSRRAPVRVTIMEPSIPVTPAEPIEVTMFELPVLDQAVVDPPTPESAPSPAVDRAAISATARASGTEVPARPEGSATVEAGAGAERDDGTARPGMLSMRRGAVPDLSPFRQHLPAVDDPDAPPPWAPPPPSGELDPSGGGTYERQRPGFIGRVGADGKATFTDKPAFSAKFKFPHPVKVARRAARGLEGWQRDPWKQVRGAERDPTSGLETDDYTRPLDQDDKADHGDVATVPILGGQTELTDWVMRKVGQDPYQSDKLRWMDATRDERVEIGRVHRARQLDRADEIMRRHLDRLWARTDLDLAAKRVALFELWDDGAEDGDRAVVEAATRTRALVVGFVRAHLPAGSAGAFTAAELDALNRRRTSRARFAPYP